MIIKNSTHKKIGKLLYSLKNLTSDQQGLVLDIINELKIKKPQSEQQIKLAKCYCDSLITEVIGISDSEDIEYFDFQFQRYIEQNFKTTFNKWKTTVNLQTIKKEMKVYDNILK